MLDQGERGVLMALGAPGFALSALFAGVLAGGAGLVPQKAARLARMAVCEAIGACLAEGAARLAG